MTPDERGLVVAQIVLGWIDVNVCIAEIETWKVTDSIVDIRPEIRIGDAAYHTPVNHRMDMMPQFALGNQTEVAASRPASRRGGNVAA